MEGMEMMKRFVILTAIALLATGALAQVKELGDGTDHVDCYQEPAPTILGDTLHFEDFNAGIPGSWTIIDNGADGLNGSAVWTTTGSGSCFETANWASPPGGGGLAAG